MLASCIIQPGCENAQHKASVRFGMKMSTEFRGSFAVMVADSWWYRGICESSNDFCLSSVKVPGWPKCASFES